MICNKTRTCSPPDMMRSNLVLSLWLTTISEAEMFSEPLQP